MLRCVNLFNKPFINTIDTLSVLMERGRKERKKSSLGSPWLCDHCPHSPDFETKDKLV